MPDENPFVLAADEEDARAALNRALRDLARAKAKSEELVEAVYRAVRDAMDALTLPPVESPQKDGRKRGEEVAVAVLSDWQLAKLTPSYNSEVCERRIANYAEKVKKLADIQRADHPVRELRVYLLGDLVEGELIFPGQAHLVDASLYRQVVVDGPRILASFLRSMSTVFERVHVVGVIGNHGALGGRARRDYHPESNADAMMYEVARLAVQSEKRITWAPNITDGERHWFATDTVGDFTFFMFHGDQVKGGFAGFPWYGFGKKLQGWRMKYSFDYALSGHFHTPMSQTLNSLRHWGNGTTESDNAYALEQLSSFGSPAQWLLFCSPKRGVTAEYLVSLT